MLGLPFGADFRFTLYKRDTSFLDLESDLGIQYLFEGGNYIKAFWNNRSSSLLTVDENDWNSNNGCQPPSMCAMPPSVPGVRPRARLDYRFNPEKAGLPSCGAGGGRQADRTQQPDRRTGLWGVVRYAYPAQLSVQAQRPPGRLPSRFQPQRH
ncbi:MAG: hypothetical protein H6557_13005 [Lewinellaceae bacterium]|nr:hypothetical protein [Lewinellaceae bacterium]